MRKQESALAFAFAICAGLVSNIQGLDSPVCRFARESFECSKILNRSTCESNGNCYYALELGTCHVGGTARALFYAALKTYSKHATCPCDISAFWITTTSGCSTPAECRCVQAGDYCKVAATDAAINYHLNGADALMKEIMKAVQVCLIADNMLNNNPANEESCTAATYSSAGQTKTCKMYAEVDDNYALSYFCDTQHITVDDLKYLSNQALCSDEEAALLATIAANSPPSSPPPSSPPPKSSGAVRDDRTAMAFISGLTLFVATALTY